MKFESLKGLRLQGVGKAIHKFFLVITFPLRRGFLFLGLLFVFIVIMAAIPMSQGVSYKHITDWYLLKYDEVKNQAPLKKKDHPEAVERKLKNNIKKEQLKEKRKTIKFKETAAPDRKYISDELKNKMGAETEKQTVKKQVRQEPTKRKTFKLKASPFRHASVKDTWVKKTQEKPYFAKIMEQTGDIDVKTVGKENIKVAPISEPFEIKPNIEVFSSDKLIAPMPEIEEKLSYRKIENLPLKYEEKPQHIEGKAIVFGANDLSVADNYIILYGIYTDEGKYDIQKATEYLRELADGKQIECEIVAYTYQHYATALCFINGKSINQNLVDAGFAENIAL